MAVSGLFVVGVFLCSAGAASGTAGFVKSPLSQKKLTDDRAELDCEAVGSPIPEIQWWYEGLGPNASALQLWDGAWQDRVKINATYKQHSTSTISVANLTLNDSGTYECRASNDPDRNHLSKSPKIKWIRSQANVIVIERPHISATPDVTFGSNVLISCNITDPPTDVKGRYWMVGDRRLDANDTASNFISYTIAKVDDKSSGEYHCVFDTVPVSRATVYVKVKPNVYAYKKFEHADEKDVAVLTCKCNSYPPITEWTWFKVVDSVPQRIVNGSEDRVFIKSESNRTDLKIHSLDIEKDRGEYICNGTNEMGEGSATISLRVRSRLAALWPFLGIVAEVLILVTIIFFHEKRTKPNEVPDDDDGGSAPLKSNAANHEKNVRQRNAT